MDEYHSEEGTSGEPCFYYPIPGGLLDKDVIEITGTFYGEKIVIEILGETYVQNGVNTALPLQFTLSNNGRWSISTFSQTVSRQSQSGSCESTKNFQIRIVAYEAMFEVHLNGTLICTQKHLIPLPHVSHLLIDGEAEFTGVEFKDLCSENDGVSSHSSKSSSPSPKGIVPGFTRLSEKRRSSNRKPQPAVMVPTHGSLQQRQKTALNTHEEKSRSSSSSGSATPQIQAAAATEPVRASLEPAGVAATAALAATTTPGSRESKKKGLLDKLNLRRSSKRSTSKPGTTAELNDYANPGGATDVWVDQGGREVSVDGPGTFVVAGAVSAPNLNVDKKKEQTSKEKKRHSILKIGGSKHERASSSPPAQAGEKNKKKNHLGLHLHHKEGKEGKIPKEPKAPKDSGHHGKLHIGKRRGSKNAAGIGVGTAGVVTMNATVEHENQYATQVDTNAVSRTSSASSRSSSGNQYALQDLRESVDEPGMKNGITGDGIGGYAIASETALIVKSEIPRSRSNSSSSSSSKDKGRAPMPAPILEERHGSLSSRSRSSHTSRSSTRGVAVAGGMGVSGASKKEIKGSQLKGDSSEIADNLMQGRCSLTNANTTSYTGTQVTVPLKITGEDLLSTGGFTPLIGAKGSYNLETTPDRQTGTFIVTKSPSISSAGSRSGSPMPIRRASHDELVHAARPDSFSGGGVKSATLPAGAAAGGAATVVVAGGAGGKDKKDKKSSKRQHSHSTTDGDDKLRKRDRVSAFFKRIFKKGKHDKKKGGQGEPVLSGDEMIERDRPSRSSSRSSRSSEFNVTAKPSETCRYASQLRGERPALQGNSLVMTLCGTGHTIIYPLQLTDQNIAEATRLASADRGSMELFVGITKPRGSLTSSESSYSESAGGTRRKKNPPQAVALTGVSKPRSSSSSSSSSSWSISANGTRRPKGQSGSVIPLVAIKRTGSSTSGTSHTSVSDGGTRRHIRSRHDKHRYRSNSSSSSSGSSRSPMPLIQMDQQVNVHAAPSGNSFLIDIPQNNSVIVHSKPQRSNSTSSASSIASLYGRVIIIGQSSDFQQRMQSYRRRMGSPKAKTDKSKQKRKNGYGSDTSTSSISSMDSNSLPPFTMKVHGGNIAYYGGESQTIFDERPKKPEDTQAFYSAY